MLFCWSVGCASCFDNFAASDSLVLRPYHSASLNTENTRLNVSNTKLQPFSLYVSANGLNRNTNLFSTLTYGHCPNQLHTLPTHLRLSTFAHTFRFVAQAVTCFASSNQPHIGSHTIDQQSSSLFLPNAELRAVSNAVRTKSYLSPTTLSVDASRSQLQRLHNFSICLHPLLQTTCAIICLRLFFFSLVSSATQQSMWLAYLRNLTLDRINRNSCNSVIL